MPVAASGLLKADRSATWDALIFTGWDTTAAVSARVAVTKNCTAHNITTDPPARLRCRTMSEMKRACYADGSRPKRRLAQIADSRQVLGPTQVGMCIESIVDEYRQIAPQISNSQAHRGIF